MDSEEFRLRAKQLIDYITGYHDTIRQRLPIPNVKPGYLKALVPEIAPENPDKWDDVFEDIERVIVPGLSHWQSPQFHGYFSAGQSYPDICAELLSSGLGTVGLSWVSAFTENVAGRTKITCPASTELEVVVMDWLGKMLQLPSQFLAGGKGGGIIQNSASEAILVSMLTARSGKLTEMNANLSTSVDGDVIEGVDGDVFSRLVVYASDQAHFCVRKACLFGAVRFHNVPSDIYGQMTGPALANAVASDLERGLVPFYCVATLGTTGMCAFDLLKQIGPICHEAGVWLHVDAAYAGASFICPEFRPLLDGVEFADSFNFNPHKWLLTHLDCSALWYRDSSKPIAAHSVKDMMLNYGNGENVTDFSQWEIPLGRRFRSLKLWFVLRLYGVKGLQAYIRKHVELAHEFEKLVANDNRFEVTHPVTLGLVCFRLRQRSNQLNEMLLANLNKDRRVYLTASTSKGVYFLRLAICAKNTKSSDIRYSWDVIREVATPLLK